MSLKIMYPPQKDSPTTFLLGDISATDTLIAVANAATLPQTMPYPLTIGIDKSVTETVMVTATNLGNNQLTITRGTPAYAWLAGSKLARVLTAKDFKDVQDNINDINTALVTAQGTIATQGTDVDNLKTAVGNASSGLVKGLADEVTRAKAAEASEASRATTAESVLTSGKINRTELAQVITDWAYSADGTQLLVTINRYNASTQQATQYTRTLPVVSAEAMGVMTPEAYNEITALRNDVNTLTNLGGRFIGLSFATKAALTSYVVPASVKTSDFTYVLDDETKGGSTTRYVRNGTTWDFTFVIDYDPVGLADATTAGIVKSDSGSTDGKVFVETNGTMSVVGWANVVKTNDIRLTNARTPTAHKSTHATGQADAITPADIGALATNGASSANTVAFSVAGTRTNVVSGETHATLLGKIMKWFTDLGTAAFKNIPASGNAAAAEVVIGSDTRLTNARAASDVYTWAKASTKPAYNASEVGALASDADVVTSSDEIPADPLPRVADLLGEKSVADFILAVEKAAINGVASLGSDGKVPAIQLPSMEDATISLASSVKTALGLTGDKFVSDALLKLSGSALYKASTSAVALSTISNGSSFTVDETGVGQVEFVKITDNYASTGNALVVRKNAVAVQSIFSTNGYYLGSTLDTYLETTYYGSLKSDIKALIPTYSYLTYTQTGGTSGAPRHITTLANKSINDTGAGDDTYFTTAAFLKSSPLGWTRSGSLASNPVTSMYLTDGTLATQSESHYVYPAFLLANTVTVNTLPTYSVKDVAGNNIVIPSAQLDNSVKIIAGYYMGTGAYGSDNKNSLTFSFVPRLVIVSLSNDSATEVHRTIMIKDQTATNSYIYGTTNGSIVITWNDATKTAQWYNNSSAIYQLNESKLYRYFAVG